MKKRVLIVLLCLVGALSSAFAAEKKVRGVVISSEDNLPLIGASVYVTAEDLKKAGGAQTTMGVITDVDGQFSIAIPAGITRFFCSYVGYDVLEVKLVPGKEHYELSESICRTFHCSGIQRKGRPITRCYFGVRLL